MPKKKLLRNAVLISLFCCSLTGFAQTSGVIDLNALENYANQPIPTYITKDNTPPNNPISDAGATLGRVLFYDKQLSVNNTIACASCHQQSFAFSDPFQASIGVNGVTGRHSMRLINSRFADEEKFFWDERAASLEEQTTMPIQDHTEMGFSGQNGDPGLDSLFDKLAAIDYYHDLFTFVYGDEAISEARIQLAIAQFVRSIQSFDSRYDDGRAQVNNENNPFPNFSNDENQGKQLFLTPPVFDPNGNRIAGGAGCAGCHRPPEFDIDPNSGNNGFVNSLGGGTDFTNTRVPTLRDLVDPNGNPNGGFMHTGGISTLNGAVDHYEQIQVAPGNNMIDPRLTPGGNPQHLRLQQQMINQLAAFLETLTGSNVYTDPKWSNPFDSNGNLIVVPVTTTAIDPFGETIATDFILHQNYPNPFNPTTTISYQVPATNRITLSVLDLLGRKIVSLVDDVQAAGTYRVRFNGESLGSGIYLYQLRAGGQMIGTRKMLLVK